MRDIKDFQARYDRWKNGERYWDIRDVDLPRYDTADKNTDQEYIFQRQDGTYYSSPTNSSAFTEDVTPVLKRNLSNPATWDFVGSDTNKKYTTQYTDDQLRQMAQDSMPNAEMIPWIDRAGNKQRSARIIGLSPADPIGSTVVEFAGGLPAWKALDYAGNKLAIDFARDFAFTKFGNWTRNKILSNQLNNVVNNTYKPFSTFNPYIFKNNFTIKQGSFGDRRLIPIQNSTFDNYANKMYQLLDKKVEYPEIHLVNNDLGHGVVGNYNYRTKVANVLENDDYLLSTAIHEAISHHTDDLVEYLPINKFIPITDKDPMNISDFYRFLSQRNDKFHKYQHSSDWNEMRATLNEIRSNSKINKIPIEQMSKDEILNNLRKTNGYGKDYYNSIKDLSPNDPWFAAFRYAYKYLPIVTPPLIYKNYEKEK